MAALARKGSQRGETDTDDKMKRRVEYDLYYIENWSFILDVKIIWMTIFKVWTQDTAY
jgi:putative colanic acid biosynthesis UDP-glucose lipid carrier transferase